MKLDKNSGYVRARPHREDSNAGDKNAYVTGRRAHHRQEAAVAGENVVSQNVLTVKYLPPRRRRRRPPPGDDGECMYEVTYYLGRRERDTAGDGDGGGEYAYE